MEYIEILLRILMSYGISILVEIYLGYRIIGRKICLREFAAAFCFLYLLFCIPYIGKMQNAALLGYVLQILGVFFLLIFLSRESVSKCLGISGTLFLFIFVFIKSFFVTGGQSPFNLLVVSENLDLTVICTFLAGDILLLITVYFVRKINISLGFHMLYRNGNKFATVAVYFFIAVWLITMKKMSDDTVKLGDNYDKLSMMTILVFVGGTLLLLIILLIYYRNERKNEKIKMQNTMLMQQQVYISTLENLQVDIKKLQHDYKNIIAGLYIMDNNENKTLKFLDSTIQEFDDRLEYSIQETASLSRIKLEELKGLILTKMVGAREEHVQFNLEVFQTVEDIFMDIVDFKRCLGILLDNGIEAAGKSGRKEVWLVLIQEEYKFTLIVKNTYAGEIKMKDIWEDGYSTKGKNRGVGLCNYKEIISRYPRIIKETKIEEDVFTQILKIPSKQEDAHF